MLDFYNDKEIKFQHTPDTQKYAFNLNNIGAHDSDAIDVTTLTHTDANTIYVNGATGSDVNAGTAALPKVTILAAINVLTATKIYVLVMNSQHFAEDLSTATTTYLTGLFANTAITATLSTRTTPVFADADTIFFGATSGGAGGTGTLADSVNTIALAVGLCDATHQRICEIDGATYTEAAIEFTGNFLGMYALEGKEPTYKPTVTSDSSDYTDSFVIKSTTNFATGNTDLIECIELDNGNFVIVYEDDDTNLTKFKIIGPTGTTIFTDSSGIFASLDTIDSCKLNNGNWVVAVATGNAQFVIYDEDGLEVKGTTLVKAGVSRVACCELDTGGFVVVYWVANTVSFQRYDEDGVAVGAEVDVEAAVTGMNSQAISACLLSGGYFVMCYADSIDALLRYAIYDEDGAQQVAPATFNAGDGNYIDVEGLLNDTWVVVYYDGSGKYQIRNAAGGAVKAETQFDAGNTHWNSVRVFKNGDWIVCYSILGGDCYYAIYDNVGNAIIGSTRYADFTANGAAGLGLCVLLNGTWASGFPDPDNGMRGDFVIYYPYSWTGLEVSAASTINGFILDGNDSSLLTKLVEANSAKPTIDWCDIKNCTNPVTTTKTGYGIYGDNDIDLSNSRVFDNDAGLYTASNDCEINDCQFFRNDAGQAIEVEGAGAGIIIEHCDIFNNYAGIYLNTNDGNEVLKNNIIHNNDNLGIKATTAVGYSYTTNTDSVENATAGSSVILANPLYINEGAVSEAAIDLNIKTTVEGYPSDSPAKDLADDTRNAGSHDVRYIGAATTWTSITVDKPARPGIKVWYEAVSGSKNVGQDGTVEYSKKGQTENVEIHWTALQLADFVKVRKMWASDENEIRLYPDPTTNANSYNTYTLERPSLNASASNYELTKVGIEDITLKMSRKYEEA